MQLPWAVRNAFQKGQCFYHHPLGTEIEMPDSLAGGLSGEQGAHQMARVVH